MWHSCGIPLYIYVFRSVQYCMLFNTLTVTTAILYYSTLSCVQISTVLYVIQYTDRHYSTLSCVQISTVLYVIQYTDHYYSYCIAGVFCELKYLWIFGNTSRTNFCDVNSCKAMWLLYHAFACMYTNENLILRAWSGNFAKINSLQINSLYGILLYYNPFML